MEFGSKKKPFLGRRNPRVQPSFEKEGVDAFRWKLPNRVGILGWNAPEIRSPTYKVETNAAYDTAGWTAAADWAKAMKWEDWDGAWEEKFC